MGTTAGSCALLDSRPAGNADIVNDVMFPLLWVSQADGPQLVEKGVIILGKANMTELLGMKCVMFHYAMTTTFSVSQPNLQLTNLTVRGTSGWSPMGGMCQPAYIPTGYKIGELGRGETVGV